MPLGFSDLIFRYECIRKQLSYLFNIDHTYRLYHFSFLYYDARKPNFDSKLMLSSDVISYLSFNDPQLPSFDSTPMISVSVISFIPYTMPRGCVPRMKRRFMLGGVILRHGAS